VVDTFVPELDDVQRAAVEALRANSSFAVDGHGVLADRADRYRRELDSNTVAQIEEPAGDLYEQVR
jgi:hypothetical protein